MRSTVIRIRTTLTGYSRFWCFENMQIPIKEIIRNYESRDMKVLVQTFVSRIQTLNDEIATLSELKSIVNDFLEAMLDNGISHILKLIKRLIVEEYLTLG